MRNTLHITNGDSVASLMREAGIGGLILPWRDVLHDGPVPFGLDLRRSFNAPNAMAMGYSFENDIKGSMMMGETNNYKIEKAALEDVAGIQRCVDLAYQHYVERLGKKPGPMIDNYQLRVGENNAYVIHDNDQVIGVLVMEISQERCLLDNVAVDPDYSGNGIGKLLVEQAEQIALVKGFGVIELYTHERMTENIAMYQKWGYGIDRYIEEKGFKRVYMTKKL